MTSSAHRYLPIIGSMSGRPNIDRKNKDHRPGCLSWKPGAAGVQVGCGRHTRGRCSRPYCNSNSFQIKVLFPLPDRPQAGFGFHASHTSVTASRVITSGKSGLYNALVKHKKVPRPTVHVIMRAP